MWMFLIQKLIRFGVEAFHNNNVKTKSLCVSMHNCHTKCRNEEYNCVVNCNYFESCDTVNSNHATKSYNTEVNMSSNLDINYDDSPISPLSNTCTDDNLIHIPSSICTDDNS